MNETIELDRYFERIGYPGPRTPTLNVLHALTAAHSQAIPFENIDVLLGRPIRLEPQALQQKMVAERRGGYCFEQNGLLLAVLTRFLPSDDPRIRATVTKSVVLTLTASARANR